LEKNKIKPPKINKKSTIREYAEALTIAILLALFIRTFIIQAFKIPSGSMKPTLLIGDHLLVNKFAFGIKIPFIDKFLVQFKKPERGDVVVFKWPEDESKDFIKRVIGVAGDTIEIKNDQLYVNDKKVEKTLVDKNTKHQLIVECNDNEVSNADVYEEIIGNKKHKILVQPDRKKNENFGPVKVPENAIFVMGDNRDNSADSRYWGYVKLEKIKGKALIIYWSWPHWKRFLKIIR
jgi:signal peptidase I